MITTACRNCEDWIEKDIIYAVGVVPKEEGREGKQMIGNAVPLELAHVIARSIINSLVNM